MGLSSHVVSHFFLAWQNLASSIEEVVHSIEVAEGFCDGSLSWAKGFPFKSEKVSPSYKGDPLVEVSAMIKSARILNVS